MRFAATGTSGQVVAALKERAPEGSEIVAIGRPTLDLADVSTIAPALAALQPDVLISAAAYTAVDKAEKDEEAACAINGVGAGEVARVAAELGVPIIHLSTDYVFDGYKNTPYIETDATNPLGAYGRSKLLGERLVQQYALDHVILRTAWIYSPFGANFVKTMLHIARERDEIRVVADQFGNPTSALDIADAILGIAENLVTHPANKLLRGIFHMTGTGEASWAEFAAKIFETSLEFGGPSAKVIPIPGLEYKTPALRPSNSRLDCAKLAHVHGAALPHWTQSTRELISRLTK